jgi:streptogramin lyase
MKRFLVGFLAVLSFPLHAQDAAPVIPFESVPDVLKLPQDLYLGEVTGVAVNSKGHLFVLSRGNTNGPAFAAAAAQLLEFAPDGKFIREIGKHLYAWSFGHVVRVDKSDNIWAVDKGSDMIIKFNPQGHVVMVFGRKPEASDENAVPYKREGPPPRHEDGRFRQPTDVTWDPAGDIFISDGYVNSRVAKFDKNGNWVKSWGERGVKPGEFNTPHSITADAQGNIYVADRFNRRIQVFDSDGNFQRAITIDVPFDPNARPAIGNKPDPTATSGTFAPGAPWAVCITPGPKQVLFASDAYPGRLYKLSLDGKILGVLGESGKQLKQFGWVHEIACPSENVIFVAELLNWRVQKLILHPR